MVAIHSTPGGREIAINLTRIVAKAVDELK
jgi:hypothetical protein